MSLPRVKIYFENGALGSVASGADGVLGLVSTAFPVGNFELEKPYLIRRLDDLAGLSIEEEGENDFLYRHVKEFYAEAGEGTELWIMGFSNDNNQSALVANSQKLIKAANGRLKGIAVAFNPSDSYNFNVSEGLDEDVFAAMQEAQTLADWATNIMYAPLFYILEARGYNGDVTSLVDLTGHGYNRVGLLLGDTQPGSTGACIGLLAGRIAKLPVQRHIGRVKDGAVNTLSTYILDTSVEDADVESIHDKGFITFRIFVGRAGYFFSDDSLATRVADDYRSLARRRVIDKAYRICYDTLLEELNDEIPVTEEGKLVPSMAKSWQANVETAIISQMTAEGNLGTDPTDPSDSGVQCFIDYNQDVVATGKIKVSLKVRPYGYAKYIDVYLGFTTKSV